MRGFYRPSGKSGETKKAHFTMLLWGSALFIYNHLLFKMFDRSLYFLNNTEKFLQNWVKLGQDTCHRTHGYDAEKCHRDCKKRETSDFAKQCREDGGLYKCCIRYDCLPL